MNMELKNGDDFMEAKLSWFEVYEIRNEFDSLMTGESKHQFCIRKGKQYKISDVEIRKIINNQRWVNKDYGAYMPGRYEVLYKCAAREIRNAFINKQPNVLVKDFIEIWANKKGVSKSQIQKVIYNKAWFDCRYIPPRYKK